MQQFFTTLSYFFHPLLMPILGLYILFEAPTLPHTYNLLDALYFYPDQAKQVIYIVMGILTFVAPVLSLVIMKNQGMIKSFKLEEREDRIYPFIITLFYYILAFVYVRYQWPVGLQHPALLGFFFGGISVFIALFAANFFVKVSIHSAGIFALAGSVIGYFQTQNLLENHDRMLFFIYFLIFIGGLVGAARVYLKAHTVGETILGMFIGFIVAYVAVRFGVYI